MSEDLKPTRAGITAAFKALDLPSNTTYMGDLTSPKVLSELERATRRSLEDWFGERAANISVKAVRKDNVTADISIGGPYDLLKPLLDKLGCAPEHSISFSFTTETDA